MSTNTDITTYKRIVDIYVVVAVPMNVALDEYGDVVEVLGQAGTPTIDPSIRVEGGKDAFVNDTELVAGAWRFAEDDEYDAATAVLRQGNID